MPSLFNFSFRISPWEGCLNLNFDNESFHNGFNAVCTRDHLGILWVGDPAHNDAARAIAYSLARALVHADALLTFPSGIVLDVEPVTWLEIRHCVHTKVVSGLHASKFRYCSA
jgi:hypothetical protein